MDIQEEMKLCFVCRDSQDWAYPDYNVHKLGLHFTLGKTWSPLKGHKDFELSERWFQIFKTQI